MTQDELPPDKDKDFDTASNNEEDKQNTPVTTDPVGNKPSPNLKSNTSATNTPKDEELLTMARSKIIEYFTDQYSNPYIAANIQGHLEVLSLRSPRVRYWLFRIYYTSANSIANSENVTNVISILKTESIFGQVTKELHLRVVASNDLKWYYDLTNDKWECVEISVDGWKVTNDIALFKRYNNQIPQVYPSRNYESDMFDKFMDLLNIHNPKVRLLLKCYIISLFIPNIPKPVFILYGEQGSAKTTVQELIKMLVDPSRMKTLAFPRDLKELVQKLDHNYVAYFDNLSYIKEWVSDELCRAVTGSGFSTRELYTNDDDIIRNFKRCIGLNGINLGATKADLLDRSLS